MKNRWDNCRQVFFPLTAQQQNGVRRRERWTGHGVRGGHVNVCGGCARAESRGKGSKKAGAQKSPAAKVWRAPAPDAWQHEKRKQWRKSGLAAAADGNVGTRRPVICQWRRRSIASGRRHLGCSKERARHGDEESVRKSRKRTEGGYGWHEARS